MALVVVNHMLVCMRMHASFSTHSIGPKKKLTMTDLHPEFRVAIVT